MSQVDDMDVPEKATGFWHRKNLVIWVSGFQTNPMSLSHLWRVVFHRVVIFISISLGTCAGYSGAVVLQLEPAASVTYAILFALSPLFINAGSASAMTLVVYLKTKLGRDKPGPDPVYTVVSFLTIFTMAVPAVWLVLHALTWFDAGMAAPIYVVLATALVYTLISEFFHYVVFHFVAYRVLADERADVIGHGQPANDPALPTAASAAPLAAPDPIEDSATQLEIGKFVTPKQDIILLQSQGNYLRVLTTQGESVERFRISEAVDCLDCGLGLMVHRSSWVAYAHVRSLHRDAAGAIKLVLTNGEVVKVAATRAKIVLEQLEDRISA